MASKEGGSPHLGLPASEKKTLMVRSALLRRDRLDVEGRLQRHPRRLQQVRFKDLEAASTPKERPPTHNTPCASVTPKWWGENLARQSWPQSKPCGALLEPPPHQASACTASLTSPSLQQPPWATPFLSRSGSDFGCQGGPDQNLAPQGPPASLSAQNEPPTCSLAHLCPKTCATLCPVRLPPALCSRPLYPDRGQCLSASPPSQDMRPCARSTQLRPPAPLQASSSAPLRGSPPPYYPLAQGSFQGEPTSHLVLNSSPQRAGPQQPPIATSPSAMPGEPVPPPPPASPASPPCLVAPQVVLPDPCPPRKDCQPSSPGLGSLVLPRAPLCHGRLPGGCFSPRQAEALCQVQDLLQLVPLGRGQAPEEEKEKQPLASQEPTRAVADVQSRLQSLEGVLETSQQTIRVLLGIIQDLERKEAQRDGRCSYRTGQDVANCGMCRDCACVIYSVEQDFRQQEGRLQRVLSTIEIGLGQSAPAVAPVAATPRPSCQPLPLARLPTKGEARKVWWKCFWFM